MTKAKLLCSALLASFVSPAAFATAVDELQQRLKLVETLTALYTQTVSDAQGKNVQEGSGKLQIKRPNLFRMESQTPQENQIISDGKTLWFYDPFVEQVTINWVKDAVNNTPFVLLTSTDNSHWQQYEVSQNGDTFTLKPKAVNSNIQSFSIRIDSDGTLRNFSTQEKDGQSNRYILRNITNQPLSESLFKFNPPKGAEVDDQRKSTQ